MNFVNLAFRIDFVFLKLPITILWIIFFKSLWAFEGRCSCLFIFITMMILTKCISYLLLHNKLCQNLVFQLTIVISQVLWVRNQSTSSLSLLTLGLINRRSAQDLTKKDPLVFVGWIQFVVDISWTEASDVHKLSLSMWASHKASHNMAA